MWEEASGDSSDGAEGGAKDSLTAQLHLSVYNELMHQVKHGAPGARLSARLRAALERMSPGSRRALSSRTREGCAPLWLAARRGNVEVVEYLVHVMAAPLEQRGRYAAPEERAVHRAPPLWAAAVAGHLPAVRALADAGADIDGASDSGSTPLRSACFMTHLDVVRFLCERGADLRRANHSGGTCLINSVQSARLCRYLLERGAAPDARDSQHKTALHYAVQEQRAETARLLLAAGADPLLASRAGDDALRTACVKGAAPIVALLCSRVRYPPPRLADAHELLGATQLDELHDAAAALAEWRRATRLRAAAGPAAAKRPAPPCAALAGATEWTTLAELDALAHDVEALRAQALLVAVRVLGEGHEDTVFRLINRGVAYADAFRYQRCIDLWTWALRIRIERDTLLHTETSHAACALTRLLLEIGAGGVDVEAAALRALELVAGAAERAQRLLELRPRCAAQAEAWERVLRCAAHLARLALGAAGAGGAPLRRALGRLLRARPRTAGGDSLLHLACSRLSLVRSTYFAEEAPPCVFPCVRTVRLLLACGADVAAANAARSTALHVAAVPYNFSTELVELLLAAGAHLDRPNKFGDSAAELVPLCRGSRVRPLRHVTLACLAARALLAAPAPAPAPPAAPLPATLAAFLDLHRAWPAARGQAVEEER